MMHGQKNIKLLLTMLFLGPTCEKLLIKISRLMRWADV